ncbi:hypothetical protein RVBP21_0380 [Pseudomonas phage BRkr]|nr:hypothetical protein RVBP21_0380 [Pseudomonas phage BRkr]
MLLLSPLLIGCTSTTAKPSGWTRSAVPSSFTQLCYVAPPPSADDLINAPSRYKVAGITDPWEARFLLMTDHWLLQTDYLGSCNLQIEKLRDWDKKQSEMERSYDSGKNIK